MVSRYFGPKTFRHHRTGAETSGQFGTSAEMSGQFGTSAEVSRGHFGTGAEPGINPRPNCLGTGAELSRAAANILLQ